MEIVGWRSLGGDRWVEIVGWRSLNGNQRVKIFGCRLFNRDGCKSCKNRLYTILYFFHRIFIARTHIVRTCVTMSRK